jgi:hypothetical protein
MCTGTREDALGCYFFFWQFIVQKLAKIKSDKLLTLSAINSV